MKLVLLLCLVAMGAYGSTVTNCAGTWSESPTGTLAIGSSLYNGKQMTSRRINGHITFNGGYRAGVFVLKSSTGSYSETLPPQQYQCMKVEGTSDCSVTIKAAGYFARSPSPTTHSIELTFVENGQDIACVRSVDTIVIN